MKRILIVSVALIGAAAAQAAQFTVTWTNHGPQAQSPLFWSVGDASFDIFQVGGMSSAGIKAIAEGGNVAPMFGIAAAAGSSVQAYGAMTGGPLMPGLSRSAVINVNPGADHFSFATMLGQTNDGFLGESVSSMGLRLFSGMTPLGFSVNIYGARAWDAGTEMNTQNAADLGFLGGSGNPAESMGMHHIRVHSSVIQGVGDSYSRMPEWNSDTRLMTLTVLPVPEPGTMIALGAGAMALLRRKKRSSR